MLAYPAIAGCSRAARERFSVERHNSEELEADTSSEVILVHDFGVVGPGTKHTHRFQLENTGNGAGHSVAFA